MTAPLDSGTAARSAGGGGAYAVIVPVLSALIIGLAFLWVFVAVFHAPSPRNVPLAISAENMSVIEAALGSSGQVELRAVSTRAEGRALVENRSVYGYVEVGARGEVAVLMAGANGQAVNHVVTDAAKAVAGDMAPTILDIAPPSPNDTQMASTFYAAFGVVMAGFTFALNSKQMGPRLRPGSRIAGVLVLATACGTVAAALLGPVYNAVPAPFALVAILLGLLGLASATSTLALMEAVGPPGALIASVALLTLGNATSTATLPQELLPAALQPFTQLLPTGPAVRAVTGAAYFQNDGVTAAIITLVIWISVFLAIYAWAARRQPRDSPP